MADRKKERNRYSAIIEELFLKRFNEGDIEVILAETILSKLLNNWG
jgi:hypothetical protein